ncbi:MAG TPA: sialidase family protein [Candidatus Limnocylindrales bacterium]|nr:sialidase family protein [Candidatus Limnocylindrales bacterium]
MATGPTGGDDRANRPDGPVVGRALAAVVVAGVIVAAVGVVLSAGGQPPNRASPVPSAAATGTPPAPASAAASASGTASPSASPSADSSPASSLPTTALGREVVVSERSSPFGSCAVGGPGTVTTNSEVEPFVAVDPTDPAHVAVAWQQDRWSNGGARGIVVATSGASIGSWTRSEPAFSACAASTGDLTTRVSDPWIAISPDGVAYLTGLSVTQPALTRVTVSRSVDRGRTWSLPTVVAESRSPSQFNDKESVTADPGRPGHAYLVWDQGGDAENASNEEARGRGSVLLSTTTDGGAHWSAARTIATQDGTPVGNVLGVLPNGTLVDVFVLAPSSARTPAREVAIASTDGGRTWSTPVTIARLEGRNVVGAQPPGIRGGGGLPDVAVDNRSGRVEAVWTDTQDGRPAVIRSTSADGVAWSLPVAIPRPLATAVFMPSIEVTPAGVLGVEYTDLRAATPSRPFLADRFLATSSDGGATWRERRLTESFDFATAPDAGGRFLGDYAGLATAGEQFVSAFARTTGDPADPTELVVRIDPADEPAAIVVP